LPSFPPCTHSKLAQAGLKKHNSVNAALALIPRNAPNHDVAFARRTGRTAPWDGSRIATCITCGSSTKGHPTECRRFTIRELATLQTYTFNHVFEGNITSQLRQVGNSVPPKFAKLLQRENIRHLKACDAKSDNADKKVHCSNDNDLIIII
jgi:site-specific DNA-cytosine methylase